MCTFIIVGRKHRNGRYGMDSNNEKKRGERCLDRMNRLSYVGEGDGVKGDCRITSQTSSENRKY